jgi:hypothetical protein
MKKKIIYLIAFLFCMSLLAFPNNYNKGSKYPCKKSLAEVASKEQPATAEDFSEICPVAHFLTSTI